MAAVPLDLLAEIDNLSISDGSSRTIKDSKKDECFLFDTLWSEDDASEVETSLNLTNICLLNFDETADFRYSKDSQSLEDFESSQDFQCFEDAQPSEDSPPPEEDFQSPEDFQPSALLSSNNITVRRKTKKKRHVSEDNGSEKYSSQSKSTLQDLRSSFLDNLSCSSQTLSSDVSIVLHQETAILNSSSLSGNESSDVCRKLNSDFEQSEDISPDLNIKCNLKNNDLKTRLEPELKNTKSDGTTTGKVIQNLLGWKSDGETNSFKKVSLQTTPYSDYVESTQTDLTNASITSSCKDGLGISKKNNMFQNKSHEDLTDESVQCDEVKNYSNQNNVYELKHFDSYQEPIQSNTSSHDLSMSPKVESSIGQNVFQFRKEFITPSTHVKQISSGADKSLNPLVDDNNGYIVGSNDDKSKILNKSDSYKMNLQVKQRESNNFDGGIGGSDKNVLETNARHTVSVSTLLSPQLKKTTNTTNKSPLTCRLSSSSDDENGELESNKENVCKAATKKKEVISLSSDSDSVWEDALDSDDSDCGKYNISLSSRLGKNLSERKTTNLEVKTKSGSSVITPTNTDRTPSVLPSRNLQFSDSDDDDDFEQFLEKIKTPKPKSIPRYSLKSFIVEDNWIDSAEDDDVTLITPKSVNINSKDVPKLRPSTAPTKKTTLAHLTERTLLVNKFNTPKRKTTPLKISTKDNITQTTTKNNIRELFKYYNETVFDNKLPADLPIIWNKRMTKTAGFCYYIGSTNKKCRIELSEKVVDSCDRIRDTLIHELCHAATWLIDGIKAGHGPHWKRWAHKARMVHSDLPPITRCHSYDINYKFTYRCVRCQHSFGRHSKSVNLKTARCPYCLSHLELLPRMNKDGTPAKTRAPTKFSLFVKDNYGKIKAKEPRSSHQEVMKELSKQFAQQVALDRENSVKT